MTTQAAVRQDLAPGLGAAGIPAATALLTNAPRAGMGRRCRPLGLAVERTGTGRVNPTMPSRRRWRILGAALALGWLATPVLSAVSHAATLAEAVEAAWQRSPEARPLAAQRAVQEARRDAAGRLFPPSPFVQGDATSDRFLSNQGFASLGLEIGTPVWLPGEGRATVRQAEAGIGELEARLGELRLAVAGLVRDAAGQVEEATLAGPPLERRAAAAGQLAAITEQRAQRGESPSADALLARGEALTAESALRDQRALLAQAQTRFAVITGLATAPSLAEDRSPPPRPVPEHPRLLAARRAVGTAQAALRLVEATPRDSPTIALQGRHEQSTYPERFDTRVGVVVRLPLATEARNRPRLAAAQAEVSRAEAQLALLQRELEIESRQARLGFEAAQAQLRLAEAGFRTLEQRRRQLEQAYAVGEMPLVEVIRARTAAFDSDLTRARARANQDRARARLNQALGVMP
ncbi:TolC family protein [Siccirubricoccus sp. G192]|uniref:TolC family protein n=1 Tax=Siccirubricoccus sp. G192 TaxID=2849651 RepID=UPI001C2C18AF|nr:TolC family protein [Siccirubricoccus sp. G192]MBV1796382.1 TolC family protein [Siccirubricoccus sp. G192]